MNTRNCFQPFVHFFTCYITSDMMRVGRKYATMSPWGWSVPNSPPPPSILLTFGVCAKKSVPSQLEAHLLHHNDPSRCLFTSLHLRNPPGNLEHGLVKGGLLGTQRLHWPASRAAESRRSTRYHSWAISHLISTGQGFLGASIWSEIAHVRVHVVNFPHDNGNPLGVRS